MLGVEERYLITVGTEVIETIESLGTERKIVRLATVDRFYGEMILLTNGNWYTPCGMYNRPIDNARTQRPLNPIRTIRLATPEKKQALEEERKAKKRRRQLVSTK